MGELLGGTLYGLLLVGLVFGIVGTMVWLSAHNENKASYIKYLQEYGLRFEKTAFREVRQYCQTLLLEERGLAPDAVNMFKQKLIDDDNFSVLIKKVHYGLICHTYSKLKYRHRVKMFYAVGIIPNKILLKEVEKEPLLMAAFYFKACQFRSVEGLDVFTTSLG